MMAVWPMLSNCCLWGYTKCHFSNTILFCINQTATCRISLNHHRPLLLLSQFVPKYSHRLIGGEGIRTLA